MSLLRVEELCVCFATRHGAVPALRGASLAVAHGEILGLVGESGSGKSALGLAALRLLGRAGRVTAGRILFNGRDITAAPAGPLPGGSMAMVFQHPRAALNPIRTVGRQVADVLRARAGTGTREQARAALAAVGLGDRLDAFPAQLSGGMCQRAMITMALACEPALLIADEPTTALDPPARETAMCLLATLARERGMATLLVTHDHALAARHCHRVAVMEHGQVVGTGRTDDAPTWSDAGTARRSPDTLVPARPVEAPCPTGHRLLRVRHLRKAFDGVPALDDVSFALDEGRALGLVGESGSGKSTLCRLVCRLLDADAGEIALGGEPIGSVPARRFHRSPRRREVQMVFQDAHDGLDPRRRAWDAIAHPLRRLLGLRGPALHARVAEAAEQAELPAALLSRLPHQLSGGQKARVGLARALAPRPRLLVLDEPTAGLDPPVQARILRLLDRLRRENGTALLLTSHDLRVVGTLCDQVAVLRHGRVVEAGPCRAVFAAPRTAYTRALLDAAPGMEGIRA